MKKYEKPELNIIKFTIVDVLTTSGDEPIIDWDKETPGVDFL